MRVNAPATLDKAAIEKNFYQKYKRALTAAKQQYQQLLQGKDEQIAQVNRHNASLENIIHILANIANKQQPINIEVQAVSQGNINQDGNFGVGVNQGEIKDNAKVAGILNEAQQQNLIEVITEVKNILIQVTQEYPNDTTIQKSFKTIEIIENNPSLKEKIINAAKKGGLEFFKKSFDNPVGALIGGAIEGWMEN